VEYVPADDRPKVLDAHSDSDTLAAVGPDGEQYSWRPQYSAVLVLETNAGLYTAEKVRVGDCPPDTASRVGSTGAAGAGYVPTLVSCTFVEGRWRPEARAGASAATLGELFSMVAAAGEAITAEDIWAASVPGPGDKAAAGRAFYNQALQKDMFYKGGGHMSAAHVALWGLGGGSRALSTFAPGLVRVAVIVPYRANPLQKRERHLQAFLAHMCKQFMPSLCSPSAGGAGGAPVDAWTIYVVRQSEDGRKFNRGALLNVGALRARQDGFNVLVMHDVDLLPGKVMRERYTLSCATRPVHQASAWGLYTYPGYTGGVITFHPAHFFAANGFPNNGWGWGGEDDALRERIRYSGVPAPVKFPPTEGAYEDLEQTFPGKMRANVRVRDGGSEALRNSTRMEMLSGDLATWKRNGLNTLRYTCLSEGPLEEHLHTLDVHVRLDVPAPKDAYIGGGGGGAGEPTPGMGDE